MKITPLSKKTQEELLALLKGRNPASYTKQQAAVDEIIRTVQEGGDRAVLAYEKQFDHADLSPETLKVTREEIDEAYRALDPAFVETMKRAAANIRAYHEK